MQLAAVLAFQALLSRAKRNLPVAAHLRVFVQRFHRLIVKGIFRFRVFDRPNQGFVSIGKTRPLKIRHRICLVPDNVVQNPETQILQDVPDTENIVVRTDDPDGAVVFQNTACSRHPLAGIAVIGGQAFKTVPFFINAADIAVVRTGQSIAELEIIRRIGKNQINRTFFHLIHNFNTVVVDNRIKNSLCLDTAHVKTAFLRLHYHSAASMIDRWL